MVGGGGGSGRMKSIKIIPVTKLMVITNIAYCFIYPAALKEKKPELPVVESRAVKILADNVKEQDKTDELQEEWVLTANVLNRFFIWLFLSSVVITLIAVFAVDTRFET